MQKQKLTIATFYLFTNSPNYQEFRPPILEFCLARGIKGTVLLAEEGINSTVSGSGDSVHELLSFLREDPLFGGVFRELEAKFSYADPDTHTFTRMKVKLKKEIVTLGREEADPRKLVGRYLDPEEWNKLISDPDTILIDTRNDYEFEIGSFEGAREFKIRHFRQFPDEVLKNLDPSRHKKVAMFCTGGIRCEKASSFMLAHGFEEVYHLKGGILKYLETVPPEESLWRGECFVFDHRVAVDHSLKPGHLRMCLACGRALDTQETTHERYEEGVSCPHCYAEKTEEDRERYRERQRQIDLATARGSIHLGN